MWVVKQCYREYDEVWKVEDSRYDTEEEALAAADAMILANLHDWVEVDEEL